MAMNAFQVSMATVLFLLFLLSSPWQEQKASSEEGSLRLLQQAATAIGNGNLTQAESLLSSVLEGRPSDPDALNLIGVVRARQDRSVEAERLFQRALNTSPTHLGAHVNLGELYINTKRPQKALEILLAGYKLAPDRAEINLKLAELYSAVGNHQRALNHLRQLPPDQAEQYLTAALIARPDDLATLRALAMVARSNGNHEKALAYLVAAQRVAPDDRGVLFDFGATAMQMGLLLDALPAFQKLFALEPTQPAYIYALAAAKLRRGELRVAEQLARGFIVLRPQDGAGFHLLGATLYLLNRYIEARTALENSLKLKPDVDAQYLLGLTLYEEGNRALAIEVLQAVVSLRPEHAAAQAALGTAYRDLGRLNDAQVALERSVELEPKDLRANYQLGLVYAKLGNKEAAQKMFDRADKLRTQERERETVILKLIEPPQN